MRNYKVWDKKYKQMCYCYNMTDGDFSYDVKVDDEWITIETSTRVWKDEKKDELIDNPDVVIIEQVFRDREYYAFTCTTPFEYDLVRYQDIIYCIEFHAIVGYRLVDVDNDSRILEDYHFMRNIDDFEYLGNKFENPEYMI